LLKGFRRRCFNVPLFVGQTNLNRKFAPVDFPIDARDRKDEGLCKRRDYWERVLSLAAQVSDKQLETPGYATTSEFWYSAGQPTTGIVI
jgi:hypothetical protein